MKIISCTLTILLFFALIPLKSQHISRNDSIINEALALISADSVQDQLQWLQDMGTRFMMAENHKEVGEHIKARFESFGMTEVKLDSFECQTNINYGIIHYDTMTWQYNVEARLIGSVYPDEEILLMGHYDNVQLDSDPELYSPGADDDGSGTVAVLETARVLMLMGYQPEKTIVFLTTAAEELMNFGYAGSEHYAAEASQAGRNIWGVINNDMIAYDIGTDKIGFSNVIGSEELTGIAALITDEYTSLTAVIPNPHNNTGSDLQPFLDAGYSGLYLEENIFNPYYHTEQDIIENCDIDYLTEVIKISCGSVIYSDISLGTEDLVEEEIYISAFPNPCSDQIRIILHNQGDEYSLLLTNTMGQTLMSKVISPQTKDILLPMSNYSPGIYFVHVRTNSQYKTIKVIKD